MSVRGRLPPEALRASLDARVLWITVTRAAVDGRACRDYRVGDGAGTALLAARSFPWRREIPLCAPAALDAPVMLLRRRRSFPLTGKVDLLDGATGARLGVVRRSGRFDDGGGRELGRFRDARSLRDLLAEGAFMALMEGMVGGEGSAAAGPTGFVLVVCGRPVGTLRRAPAPFAASEPAQPGRAARFVRRALPKRLADWLLDRSAGASWRLERESGAAGRDPLIAVAAALFAVELSHW